MIKQRRNGDFGFHHKSSMKKERSKIMEKSYKELKRTQECYRLSKPNNYNNVNDQQDKVAPQETQQIPLEKLSNVRGPRPSHKYTEGSRLSSSRPIDGLMSSAKNIEKSMPSSSRKNKSTMSLAKNIENSRPSFSRPNNDEMPSANNAEKYRPCCLRSNNEVMSSANNDELSYGKLEKPTHVGLKVDSNSTLRISKKSLPSPVVVLAHIPKNVDAMDQCNNHLDSMSNGLLNPNQGSGILSTSKDETVVDKDKDNQVSLRSVKRALSGEVHKEDLCKSMEAPHSSLALKGSKVMQDLQRISQSNSFPIFGKALSSHELTEEPIDETLPVERSETHMDDDSEEVEYYRTMKKQRGYIEIEDEEDDGDDQNLAGVVGVTAGLTTQTAIPKDCRTEVSKPSVSEFIKLQHYNSLPNDGPLLVQNLEIYEDDDSEEVVHCRLTKKRRRYIETEDEEDDGDAQNLAGVEGVTVGLKTQTAIAKDQCTEVCMPFVSESAMLQHYSLLPIDEPIWSGIFKIDSKEYVPVAAHLSPKSCERVWESSRSLLSVVEVTKLPMLDVWPKSFKASKPTVDNIALYFLPYKMRPDKVMDQLVKEIMENGLVLRAVVGEAEILIFPSVLLPEQHKTFKSEHYLWGMFRPRENKDAVVKEHRGAGCCCAHEEEMGKQNMSRHHVVKEVHSVAGLNTDGGLEAPEIAEKQGIKQELTPSLPGSNAQSRPAEGAAQPTAVAEMPANHGQVHSSLGVPQEQCLVSSSDKLRDSTNLSERWNVKAHW